MKFTSISSELNDILMPYTEWFFQQTDLNTFPYDTKRLRNHTVESACSETYLQEIVAKDGQHEGYPECAFCYDLSQALDAPAAHKIKQRELNETLIRFLGARNVAVHSFYPTNGFMGWHTNWNAHGYNILLTYNKDGQGFFRYRDPLTHEVVTLQDPIGWSCKVGYFGRRSEIDKVIYHSCGAYSPRLTLGYVVPHEDIWRSMVEDISGEDASEF
jgi:hypothetical protein